MRSTRSRATLPTVSWPRSSTPWARRSRAVPRSLGRTALDGLAVVRAAPVLILLCTLTGIGAFASFPLHILWQPRLEALVGKGLWRMGWIVALLSLTALAGNAILPRL